MADQRNENPDLELPREFRDNANTAASSEARPLREKRPKNKAVAEIVGTTELACGIGETEAPCGLGIDADQADASGGASDVDQGF